MKISRHGRAALREWRGGVPEPRKLETWRTAAEVFEPVIRELGLQERVCEAQILEAWGAIVGPFLAVHTRPTRLNDGVLYVRVVQPSLRFELERGLRGGLVEKLRERLGKRVRIREIRFGPA